MKITDLYLFLVLIPAFVSCVGEDPSPPEIETGYVHPENQFSVKVDSVNFITPAIDVSASANSGNFYIFNTEYINGWTLVFPQSTVPGQQLTVGGTDPQAVFYHYADTISGFEYTAVSGNITLISKDTIYQRISGTFEGVMHSDSDTIHVTDGHFDLHYGIF